MKWWCHSMENFSAFWSLCAVSDGFSSQRHGDANLLGFRCRKAWCKAAFHTVYVFCSTFYVFLRLDLFWCIWPRYTSHLQRSTFVKHAHIYVTMKLHMQYFHSFTQLVRMCSNPNSSTYNHIQFTALFSNIFFEAPCIYAILVIIYCQCTLHQWFVRCFIDDNIHQFNVRATDSHFWNLPPFFFWPTFYARRMTEKPHKSTTWMVVLRGWRLKWLMGAVQSHSWWIKLVAGVYQDQCILWQHRLLHLIWMELNW